MKKFFGLISTILLVYFQTTVSHGAQYWAKTYGGDNKENIVSIQQTTDGGYVLAGDTDSVGAGGWDAWIIKLDADGDITWEKTVGGDKSEFARSIKQTMDGGYVVGGVTNSVGTGVADIWVLKLDADGGVTWQKTYGGTISQDFGSIQQTTDGGYVVAGETRSFGTNPSTDHSDIWVLKLDADGGVTWQKTYGGNNRDYARSIKQTMDGGYVVAGYSWSFDNLSEAWIMKLDSNGGVIWQKAYGRGESDFARSIQQTIDAGYVIAGNVGILGPDSYDAWVMKLDSNGDVTWQKTYGGSDWDEARSIQQTKDGGYVVAGLTHSFGVGDYDAWVMKLDSNGDVTWQKTYGGSDWDSAYSIQQTKDGGYVIAGGTDSFSVGDNDAFVLRLDNNGEIPNCDIIQTSHVTITDPEISGQETNAIIKDTSASVIDIDITQDSSAIITTVCEAYGTIIIEDCDTGVMDREIEEGLTMSNMIEECALSADGKHGKFARCVAKLTNEWKKDGLISGREKGSIQSCVAQSNRQ